MFCIRLKHSLSLLILKYGSSTMCLTYEKRILVLDSCVNFIRCFYFDMCKLLRPCGFFHMYEDFVPNVDYSDETFKIINKPYLEYCTKMFNK